MTAFVSCGQYRQGVNELDIYKKMCIELPGIKDVLLRYSDESTAAHAIAQLEIAIKNEDIEAIQYCLSIIKEWYGINLSNIHANQYVIHPEDHDRSSKMINEFYEGLRDYSFPPKAIEEESGNYQPVILISHKGVDKDYGDALEHFITGLGIKKEQLIYTSHPLHKIPLDMNIYEYLRKNINRKNFIIFLWSNEYLESPSCLNEMGAAWVTQCDYTNVYTHDFAFGNPKYHECAVDTRKMGAVLNGDAHCKQSMLELKEKIEALFELQNDEKIVTHLLDQFVDMIRKIIDRT
jgi:hypothetical protein